MSLISVVIAVTAAAPAASPPATAPTPLTQIGVTRTRPICTPIVAHANGAITSALDNDRALGILTFNLRSTDIDKLNELQRRNTLDQWMQQAGKIRENASAGDAEVKRLRDLAQASSDPQRKAELKTFADALGGAIYRQKKAAVEFMRDVVIWQGRAEAKEVALLRDGSDPMVRDTPPPIGHVPPTMNQQLRGMADELADRAGAIRVDEGVAADHSVAATSGC